MNKLSMVLAILFITATSAQAAGLSNVSINGFVDTIWTLSNGAETNNTTNNTFGEEGQFDTTAEVDLTADLTNNIKVRFDADLFTAAPGDSAELEQGFFTWKINQQIGLKAGVFNNDLGFEAGDAPDMYQITPGQISQIWDQQTVDYAGNNLSGLELSYDAGQFVGSIGYLNDIGSALEENSIKVSALIHASSTIDIRAGLITQDASAENIVDISLTMNPDPKLIIGAEIFTADEIFDLGLMVMANYKVNNEIAVTGRFDQVSYDSPGADDTTSITFAALYSAAANMFINAEIRINSDDNNTLLAGEGDGTTARMEFLATF